MPEKVAVDGAKRIFRIVISAPIEAVWAEITRSDAPIKCFFNSRMCLSPGGLVPGSKLAMRTPNGKSTGVVGEILACEPPYLLSHTFRFTSYDDPPCTVTYELRELPGGTEFTLRLADVPAGTRTEKQMVRGGTMIASILRDVCEHGRPSRGARLFLSLITLFPSPRRCRSTAWPV